MLTKFGKKKILSKVLLVYKRLVAISEISQFCPTYHLCALIESFLYWICNVCNDFK